MEPATGPVTYNEGVLTFATDASSVAGTYSYMVTASHTDTDGLTRTFDPIDFDVIVLDCSLARLCAGEQESNCVLDPEIEIHLTSPSAVTHAIPFFLDLVGSECG